MEGQGGKKTVLWWGKQFTIHQWKLRKKLSVIILPIRYDCM